MRPLLFFALLGSGSVVVVNAFPNSQNPFAGGPSVSEDSVSQCDVQLFDKAALDSYGAVLNSPYLGESNECPGPWSKIIIKIHGSVAGVQFDRAGAIWLAGVELLRTTTPEPTTPGIEWKIERDVTSYSSIFYAPSNATLQIPNTVNDQYTGVIYITATLHFFAGEVRSSGPSPADAVIPLLPPPSTSNPWNSMSIAGDTIRNTTFKFPRSDTISAILDLYASGHGCEEFCE